jgi:zinc transporter 2
VSIVFLWVLTIWLLYEATLRFYNPPEIEGTFMFITAVLGLIFNLIQMKILHSGDGHYHLGGGEHNHAHDHGDHDHNHHDHDHEHGHDHHHDHDHHDHNHEPGHSEEKKGFNLNVESAFLHVMGDMLMSVGVIIAAIIIYVNPKWWVADPICTYLFSVIIGFTTLPVFTDCVNVMMEGSPERIDVEKLQNEIFDMEDV